MARVATVRPLLNAPAIPTTSAEGSLWLASANPAGYPALDAAFDAALDAALEVDVAVIGGGIAGLSAALLLKRDGARVAVLEAARVGTGVTGCTTAKVSALQATVYSTIAARHGDDAAATYAAASQAGVARISQLAQELAIECDLEHRPAFTYALAASERASVEQEVRAAIRAGLGVEMVEQLDLPFDVHGAARLDEQVQLHPVRYVQGLAAAVQGDGSHVFENTRVQAVHEGSPCRVTSDAGELRAEHVVVATHYPILDRGLYFARLKVQRSYCVAARLAGGAAPRSMSISAGSNARSVRSHREMVIVGGEGHPAGSGKAKPERFERLAAFARESWDVAEVTHRWSAHDSVSYDHLPMIGSYRPGSSRLWVTTGFMKWGLSSATFGAMILADRIAGRENPWAATFSPHRLSLRSGHEVAQLGAKFGVDLVADRLRPPQALSRSRIPRGEARVLADGHGKKGVYRDGEDNLHGVSLRCTHLGCLLRFNAAERSWDCPCHGSRFDVDGSVLEGPAVHPLQRRDP